MNIRPFDYSSSDYEALVTIHNVVHPTSQITIDMVKRWDVDRRAKPYFERCAAVVDGQIVSTGAAGTAWGSESGDEYYLAWTTHPEWVVSADLILFNHFFDRVQERNPIYIDTYQLEADTHRIERMYEVGFQLQRRDLQSLLTVADFDFDHYGAYVERMPNIGIHIVTMADLEASVDGWVEKLESAEWELRQDLPLVGRRVRYSPEEWLDNYDRRPVPRDGYFVAVTEDDEYVGVSFISTGTSGKLYTGLTAVRRDWRRKGVATALKTKAIMYARGHDGKTIRTDNEANNPMYLLNQQLGFKPLPTWCNYVWRKIENNEDTPI